MCSEEGSWKKDPESLCFSALLTATKPSRQLPAAAASLRDSSFYSWQNLCLNWRNKRGRSCRGLKTAPVKAAHTLPSLTTSDAPEGQCTRPRSWLVTVKGKQKITSGYKGLSSTDRPGAGPEPSCWDPTYGEVCTAQSQECSVQAPAGAQLFGPRKYRLTWNQELWALVLLPSKCDLEQVSFHV